VDILDSFYHDRRRLYSANIPNNGAVSNLPNYAILELPAIAGQEGMVPIPMGEVPLPITSIQVVKEDAPLGNAFGG
jgi:alpha-galactosidase